MSVGRTVSNNFKVGVRSKEKVSKSGEPGSAVAEAV